MGGFLGVGISLSTTARRQFKATTAYAIDATAEAIRGAMLDPSSYATDGWRIPGTSGARIQANARASVAMQRTVSGAWEFAPHNLLTQSTTAVGFSLAGVTDNGLVGVAPPAGFNSESVRSLTFSGSGSAYRFGSLTGGTPNAPYTGGMWVRTATGSVDLAFDANDAGGNTYTITTAWQFVTHTSFGGNATYQFFDIAQNVAGTNTVYVCAPRLCLGFDASRYVPTAASALFAPAIAWNAASNRYLVQHEPARTNTLTNSAMVGASAGVNPTNWGMPASNLGFTVSTVGTGVENGLPYVDISVAGTSTTTYVDFVQIAGGSVATATPGQAWTASAFTRVVSGSVVGSLRVILVESDGGGAYLRQSVGIAGSNAFVRTAVTATIGASTATARLALVIDGLLVGTAITATIRVYCPQLEQGATETSPILTYGATATRGADYPNVTGIAAGSAGTLISDFITFAATGVRGIASLNDGTGNNRIDMRADGSSLITVAGTQVAGVNVGSLAANTLHRAAVAYSTGDSALVANGGAPQVGFPASLPVTNRLTLGDVDGGAVAPLNGGTARIRFVRRRLSNAELQSLTA